MRATDADLYAVREHSTVLLSELAQALVPSAMQHAVQPPLQPAPPGSLAKRQLLIYSFFFLLLCPCVENLDGFLGYWLFCIYHTNFSRRVPALVLCSLALYVFSGLLASFSLLSIGRFARNCCRNRSRRCPVPSRGQAASCADPPLCS